MDDDVGSRVRIAAAACLVASGLLAGGASASVAFADPVSSGDAGDKHTNDSVRNGSAEKPKSGFDDKKTPPPGDGMGGQSGTDPVHHPKAGSENKDGDNKDGDNDNGNNGNGHRGHGGNGHNGNGGNGNGNGHNGNGNGPTATAQRQRHNGNGNGHNGNGNGNGTATATAPATAAATTATATTATAVTAPAMATAVAAKAGETRQTQAIATRRTRTTARPVGRGGRGLSVSLRDLAAAVVAVAATPRCRPAIPAFRRVCSFRRS